MPRRAAALLATMVIAFVIAIASLARAQEPECQIEVTLVCSTYIPIVMTTDPTPVPTAIPPTLDILVIQQRDMPSRFRVDKFHGVTNEEAAAGYADPAAALLAFQQQGRESSWYVLFTSDISFSNASGVSDQVIRFATVEGADLGLDYAVQHEFSTSPGYYGPFPLGLGERSGYYIRTITEGETSWDEFFFVIRDGRYVALVQVVGISSALDTSEAKVYAQKAFARLP
jgi:hypothetical protein